MDYLKLCRSWADALLRLQVSGTGHKSFDGGILCPSCTHIHGRCPDAIYAFVYLGDRTGERKYIEAARQLFQWQDNMLCDDGSLYNDANNAWNGTTAFAAINLCDALPYAKKHLPPEEIAAWEKRLGVLADWTARTITTRFVTNINYLAGGAATLALCGQYFGRPEYLKQAATLADHVMARYTPNGLLYGEGKPQDAVSRKGCLPIDIGYNVEESTPLLLRYAMAAKRPELVDRLRQVLHQQLRFMMPDGAWDNSFGTRLIKWTLWGSRTSDGCQGGYALLAADEPQFAEAVLRNTRLMAQCTHEGLLHGGPDYRAHGEKPCSHHTITHINALALALEAGIERLEASAPLPIDAPEDPVWYYPEIDTYKLSAGQWRATVTGYDFGIDKGHATGGTVSMLYHMDGGQALMSSAVDYTIQETLNQQLPRQKATHRPLTPRLEIIEDGLRYAQCYDEQAMLRARAQGAGVALDVQASLVSLSQQTPGEPITTSTRYTLSPEGLTARVGIGGWRQGVRYVLPLIGSGFKLKTSCKILSRERIFNLCGGYMANEYVLEPNVQGDAATIDWQISH